MLVATGTLALIVAQSQNWLVDRDFFTYWGGGRGLLDRVNLYQPRDWAWVHQNYGSQWLENPVFIYAPPTAVLFAPLAALPIQIASVVWVWLSEIFIVISFLLLTWDLMRLRLARYAPWWALGVALSLPVILTMFLGQASALILLLLVLTAVLWEHSFWFAGGLTLGLTVVKPQPVLLLLPTLAFWLLLRKRWNGLAGLSVAFGVNLVATFALYPNFLSDWLAVATSKVNGVVGRMPTLWGITYDVVGDSRGQMIVAIVLVLLVVLANGIVVWRLQARSPREVMAVGLLFSLVVTPYLWNYDQVLLLLPLFVGLRWLERRGAPVSSIMLIPLALAGLELLLLLIAGIRVKDTLSVILPLLLGILLWYAARQPSVIRPRQSSSP